MTTPTREPRFYPWPGGIYMMGRFSVPRWFFDLSPRWLHTAADWCGGVEPSPWRELAAKIRGRDRRREEAR